MFLQSSGDELDAVLLRDLADVELFSDDEDDVAALAPIDYSFNLDEVVAAAEAEAPPELAAITELGASLADASGRRCSRTARTCASSSS